MMWLSATPKKFSSAQIEHAKELLQNHTLSQVESLTGISKSTLKRIKNTSLSWIMITLELSLKKKDV